MRNILAASALVVAAAVGLGASDRVGIYAVVDKVVFEPGADTPERIQVWGAFAVATRNVRDLYDEVRRGYMYFRASESRELTRREWNDLKSLAGTGRIVGFSSRFGQEVRVRAADESPQSPDKYVLGIGIQTMRAARDYAPIRALAAHISR